jgi:Flp pilus assembly protein TadG
MITCRKRPLRSEISGAGAVEFALLAPVFLWILVGIVVYGTLFGIEHQLRELSSAAARAAVAGLSDGERRLLVARYVSDRSGSLVLIDRSKLTVSVSAADPATRSFAVDIGYDLSDSIAWGFSGLLPLPDRNAHFVAVMQRGGY